MKDAAPIDKAPASQPVATSAELEALYRAPDRGYQEDKGDWDELRAAFAATIRDEASNNEQGKILPALLRNCELAWEWKGRLWREHGPAANTLTLGTVLDFFALESAYQLRRAILGVPEGEIDWDRPACAWIAGRLVISLPSNFDEDEMPFLIVDPPAERAASPLKV